MKSFLLTFGIFCVLLSPQSALAKERETVDNCRCPERRNKVIWVGENYREILEKCGEPHQIIDYDDEIEYTEKSNSKSRIIKRGKRLYIKTNEETKGNIITTKYIEEWVYNWPKRRYILYFLFENEELVRIQKWDKKMR